MTSELAGKTAIVTGASRGIGFAVAERLVRDGYRLAINGRDAATLNAARTALGDANVSIAPADVTSPEDARRMIAQAVSDLGGRLDLLVCNVGGGASVPPGEESYTEWQRVFALNLWSVTNVVEAAREHLVRSSGCIVCVSSICGVEVVPGAPVTYSAAKAALNAYIRGISRPLGKQGVRINAVAPGNILFKGSVWDRKLKQDSAAVATLLEKEVSLGALGTPEDVANWVSWLASDNAAFATGSIYVLDGGQVRS